VTQTPKLDDDVLYICDNGACYCGAHCGSSARYTGRDLSGQKVAKVTPAYTTEAARLGFKIKCEIPSCGKVAS
jgi:hypothetical protein